MAPPARHDGDTPYDLHRFLADLRRTGTGITGPVPGEPESPWVEDERPVQWLVGAHRGGPVDPPYRLRLDERQFAEAVEHDARVLAEWWPTGDGRARAYEALLLSFDAALVGVDRTPHGFVLEDEDRLQLTTHHPCPDPMAHLDPDSGGYTWSANEPGPPESEAEQAEQQGRSRHRRHAYLVLGWLEVEVAHEDGQRMDAALGHLQDAMEVAFGKDVFQRFSAFVEGIGFPSTEELSRVVHAEDERFDALLDALAGEAGTS